MSTELGYGLSERRRGICRVVVFLAVAALAVLATGCGGGGEGSTTDSEKAADAEILNEALSQELTAVDTYTDGLALLHGPMAAVGRELRAQAQEHVDALTKAIRGLGGETDAEAEEPAQPGPKSQAELLALAYEVENVALAYDQDAPSHLQTPAPLLLATALAASHAQHLVLLRQGLGTGLAASAPEAFESGELPPPESPAQPENAQPPGGAG